MEGMILQIAPFARVIHLMHGLPSFNVKSGARTMETVAYMSVSFHVCVVDSGVGTSRKPIIIQTIRGDFLVGPDNGVLIPAVNKLEGAKKVVEITNPKLMIQSISPIFHGRHIFAPAAAHLASGVPIEEFGAELSFDKLFPAPYSEAEIHGGEINAEVININKFGSLNLNILHSTWDKLGVLQKQIVQVKFKGQTLSLPFVETFGQVEKDKPLILKR